ncbi:cytochrome-c peroxidase [Azovibrio restrictus]|uniref:cytochrome-c peroxidase n=1 Tax=Azovibrio restrictus TaxID=146938 RepID=UPI0026EB6375|nr:cytochrome-c peroxidase [Azovibrio restrictus]MDD3482484.1 cytochrome-c peroxidase [Azovibrio restrictus]
MADDKAIRSIKASILKKLLGIGLLVALPVGLALLFYPSPHLFQKASAQSGQLFRAPPVRLDEPLLPIQVPRDLNAQKVVLGRTLFHDPRLSRDNSISCASCHDLSRGGIDHRSRSLGVGGREGNINAPTVFNAALNFRQFWDGRSPNLVDQVAGPIHNPVEMASSWAEVLPKLRADAQLEAQFVALYKAPPSAAAVQDAIAEFERSLVTPSPMDRWLLGDPSALNARELAGYRLFKRHGCVACHQGANVGGNLFQRFGVMQDYFADKQKISPADLGRFNVTGREEDRHVFKVPSLRNVALTAPYFHDASAATLDEAVAQMGRYQLGVELPPEDVKAIVQFLHTLTGEKLP